MRFKKLLVIVIFVVIAIFIAYPAFLRLRCKSAIANGNAKLLEQLIANRPWLATAMLDDAYELGEKEAFETLLDSGAQPDGIRHGRLTLVHSAAANDDSFWLETLLEFGADPNYSRVIRKISPLSEAIEKNQPENTSLLIQAGANIDDTTYRNTTMLQFAWGQRHSEIALLLLESGAKFNPPSPRYESFIHKYQRQTKIINPIDERGERDEAFRQKALDWFKERNLDLDNATWDESQGDFGVWEIPPFSND